LQYVTHFNDVRLEICAQDFLFLQNLDRTVLRKNMKISKFSGKIISIFLVTALVGIALPAWAGQETAAQNMDLPTAPTQSTIDTGHKFFTGAAYAGSKSCKNCHRKAYENWQKSWHSKANRAATPDIILGDFNQVTLKFTRPKKLMDVNGKTVKEKITVTMLLHRDGKRFLFTIIDDKNPANNQTHEVAFVRGGNWEQHYYAKAGDNLFAAPMRWVVADKAWRTKGYNPGYWWIFRDGRAIPRTPEEFNKINYRSVAVKCAGCHQVGYQAVPDKETGQWTGAGVEYGVGCESCHGPGSLHNKEAAQAKADHTELVKTTIVNPITDLNSLQQIQLCGRCHIRGNDASSLKISGKSKSFSYPREFLPGDANLHDIFVPWSYFSEGKVKSFWPDNQNRKNRQQYLDFIQSKHFTEEITCNSCHSTCNAGADRDLRMAKEQICNSCHRENGRAKRPNMEMFTGSAMQTAGVTCVDCHMPLVAYGSAGTAKMKQHWDRRSHTFKFIGPENKERWAMRVACDQCHVKPESGEQPCLIKAYAIQTNDESREWLNEHKQIIRQKINQAIAAIAAGEKAIKDNKNIATEAAMTKLALARKNVDFVLLDGSWGFHNFSKADALLDAAITAATSAGEN
jgi:predicted CXXCH cytochrome family protein